ncbi:MAG: hypothetical protein K6G65_09100 [Lachnospiraceae bacterium]|nr:hypothetical protein [Lachnospiraceae bacterium]
MAKYKTTDKIETFDFSDSVISSVVKNLNTLTIYLDNVTILESNEHNREIWDMRSNGVCVEFQNADIDSVIIEGYKLYDANEQLTDIVEDTIVPVSDYNDVFEDLAEAPVFSLKGFKEENTNYFTYEINADGEDNAYCINFHAAHNLVSWDRFLKKSDN